MPSPKLIGYRGTPVSKDQIIPALLPLLDGIDCTVAGLEAPSLDVVVTSAARGGKTYRLAIMALMHELADQVKADALPDSSAAERGAMQ